MLNQLLEAEREQSREREGTLRSSERQNEALREENGVLRELMAAQREELRSLKQQGGHVDDRRTTGHELGYQDSRIEQLKAQLRSATSSRSQVLAKARAGSKEALNGAISKDITAPLLQLSFLCEGTARRGAPDRLRYVSLCPEEVERIVEQPNLDTLRLRERLQAVYAGVRMSKAGRL